MSTLMFLSYQYLEKSHWTICVDFFKGRLKLDRYFMFHFACNVIDMVFLVKA